ncbi:MAG: hypothetical protein KIS86_06890 [Devosia sp.]|nr:hypothetical protein [Devosia sp.]
MPHIDLQPFCGDHGLIVRDYLSRPIHIGPWTIATNGHIAIRIPRLPDAADTLTAPASIATIFDSHSTEDLGELPLFTPPAGSCDCADCGGTGEDIEDDYGRITTSTCERCAGTGKIPLLHVTSVEISGAILAARYLEIIRALPFPKLAYGHWPGAYEPGRDQHPVHFIFDGGIGQLMPMRYAHDTHFNLVRPGVAA